jgi:oligoendopeptidase F
VAAAARAVAEREFANVFAGAECEYCADVTQLGEKSAWVVPETVKIGAARVKSFIAANKQLKERFGFFLDNTLRAAPHTQAGVDMVTPGPYRALAARMNRVLDEIEALEKQ